MKALLFLSLIVSFNSTSFANSRECHLKIINSGQKFPNQEPVLQITMTQVAKKMTGYTGLYTYQISSKSGYLKAVELHEVFGDIRTILELTFKNGKPVSGGIKTLKTGASRDIVTNRILCSKFVK